MGRWDMKVVTVAGPPSSGKTSAILKVADVLAEKGLRLAVVKFDCLSSSDEEVYAARGIPSITGVSANMCPDHYYATNIERGIDWAAELGVDVLFNESAGLCNRCSPHIAGMPAVCVVDCLSGSRTPSKIGPMLRLADLVIVTKGDIVSQAEREVFAHEVRTVNPQARIAFLNGITGQGASSVARFVQQAATLGAHGGTDGCSTCENAEPAQAEPMRLRFTMPSALCSYCMGQTKVGRDYQMGAVREMDVHRAAGKGSAR